MVQLQGDSQDKVSEYLVLARKYRPQDFSSLIGQDTLVQTLQNALDKGRLAHAFILTGVRGVGKTTTARIIAKGLNCHGLDGKQKATLKPCGQCENCKAIAEDRHMDVIEIDAASRTGVDNIREIIDSVRYKPVMARYKIYIIDEVHMLSTQAFNALLKTLEEPPSHVKFIFATTEIRKIPITVLSRCQRFDLKRVRRAELKQHLEYIAQAENVSIVDEALALLIRAADGSVRDALSLLDQAIALSESEISETQIRLMLGLADGSASLVLLQSLLEGDAEKSISLLHEMYHHGAEPKVVIEDLLRLVHWLSRIKMTPKNIGPEDSPDVDFEQSLALADKITIGLTSHLWQILLKGLGEIDLAPSPLMAAEMVILKVMTASRLPSPEEAIGLIKKISANPELAQKKNTKLTSSKNLNQDFNKSSSLQKVTNLETPEASFDHISDKREMNSRDDHQQSNTYNQKPIEAQDIKMAEEIITPQVVMNIPHDLETLIPYLREKKQVMMASEISHDWSVHSIKSHTISMIPLATAKRDLARRLSQFLSQETQIKWRVETLPQDGAKRQSYTQIKQEKHSALKEEWHNSPMMEKVRTLFPEAKLLDAQILEKPQLAEKTFFVEEDDISD